MRLFIAVKAFSVSTFRTCLDLQCDCWPVGTSADITLTVDIQGLIGLAHMQMHPENSFVFSCCWCWVTLFPSTVHKQPACFSHRAKQQPKRGYAPWQDNSSRRVEYQVWLRRCFVIYQLTFSRCDREDEADFDENAGKVTVKLPPPRQCHVMSKCSDIFLYVLRSCWFFFFFIPFIHNRMGEDSEEDSKDFSSEVNCSNLISNTEISSLPQAFKDILIEVFK